MASWKKHFVSAPNIHKMNNSLGKNGPVSNVSKIQSYLPEIYSGATDRLIRYQQYDGMDNDSVINRALDTIAEFCTQRDEKSESFFTIEFKKDSVSEQEVNIINETLQQWVKINDFERRLFRLVRETIKYGDQFFIRDPETFKLKWVSPYNVENVVINDAAGKKPLAYNIKNIDINDHKLVATKNTSKFGYQNTFSNMSAIVNRNINAYSAPLASEHAVAPIDAAHVVHFTMSDGMSDNWPFGMSILNAVFKTYKQKEMLEDSILIYRVQRAPERRVFKIAVGNLPKDQVMAALTRIKNEINQRNIPSKTNNGQNILDATLNPMSITEDYFFPINEDGQSSTVETLPGGDGLGSINDLDYWDNKLKEGLAIPKAYLSTTSSDDAGSYNDGRATTALIAEYRFSRYCERIQNMLNDTFDEEFKRYARYSGVNLSADRFKIRLNTPQNFAKYRQIELDNSYINTFKNVYDLPFISRRFAMKRWLGMTEDEILTNEKMWAEENKESIKADQPVKNSEHGENVAGLQSLGVGGENDLLDGEPADDFDIDDNEMSFDDNSETSGGNDEIPPPPPPEET